jgi:hypothetical protein
LILAGFSVLFVSLCIQKSNEEVIFISSSHGHSLCATRDEKIVEENTIQTKIDEIISKIEMKYTAKT